MRLHGAAGAALMATLPLGALGQHIIVTVTATRSTCAAVYTSGSSSYTFIQSTVYVTPVPSSLASVGPSGSAPVSIPGYASSSPAASPSVSRSSLPPVYASSSAVVPPVYGSTSPIPPVYGSSSVIPPVYGSSSAIPPVYGSSSAIPPVYGSSSAIPPVYGSSSALPPIYGSSTAIPPTYGSSTPISPPVYGSSSAAPSASASPLSDTALNAGTPFVISIQPASYGKKRQAGSATYLTATGYTSTNASEAVQYHIVDGTLQATTGGWISTYPGVESMPFALNMTLGPISTFFYAGDLQIGWNNSAFDNGAAQFYTVATDDGRQQIIVRFSGPQDPSWSSVEFAAAPTSVASTPAPSVGTTTSPYTPTASASGIVSSGPVVVPSSTTANVAPSGTCGAGSGGFNCYGAPDGNCCSSYGYCGSGPDFCGAGCQPGYGVCDPVVSSSAPVSSPSYPPVVSSGPVVVPSSTTANVAPSGTCGASSGGFNCYGAPNGNCCSSSGYCGSGAEYCGAGCQSGYGECNPVVSSSAISSGGSLVWSSSIVTSSGPRTSSQSSIPIIPVSSSQSSIPIIPISSSPLVPPVSTLPPVYSISRSISMSGSFSVTRSVTYTSTPLLTYTSAGQPIGPIGPGSSLVPSYGGGSSMSSIRSSAMSSVSSAYSSALSSARAAASSSISSMAQFSTMAPPAYSSMLSLASSAALSRQSSAMSSAMSSIASQMSTAVIPSYSAPASSSMMMSSSMAPSSASSSVIAPSSSTGNVSPLGTCGPSSGGFNCYGAPDGNCCSSYGYCGSGSDFCGAGCQAGYGDCDAVSSSSSVAVSSSSTVSVPSSSTGNVSPLGTCGPSSGGFNCYGAPDGNCCSSYGFCGSGSDFCGAGCQPGYGDCDLVSSSSPVAPASSTTAPPAYGSTSSSAPAVSPPPAYTSLNDRPSSSVSASSSTAASSSSTSAASSTSAYLVLPSPTQCSFGDPPDTDEDDSYCQVNLAQPLTLYGQTYTTSYPSTNGLIGFGAGSVTYMTDAMPDSTLGIAALAPMWTDQFAAGAYQQPTQGIFYQNTTSGITWEFYLQNMNDASRIWHYTVAYTFANAGVFTYTYYSVGSGYNGDPGVVGMQGFASDGTTLQGTTFSQDVAGAVTPGMVVTCDSGTNTCAQAV